MAESFGELLRRFRIAASLTQEALARRCKISPATIAAIERGRRKAPRLSTVKVIAEALELSPADVEMLAKAATGRGAAPVAGSAVPSGPVAPSGSAAPSGLAGRGEPAASGRASRDGLLAAGEWRVKMHGVLPAPITPLFGRHADADALALELATERLITLTGPGGVGKTRLALAVAADTLDKFPGGTYWTNLGTVGNPGSVAQAVLESLGAAEQPGVAVEQELLAALPAERALLVIDNCEHVLDEVAGLIADLLAHPSASVMATSREPLAIPGEIRWPVSALAVPAAGTAPTADALASIDSVQLFVERASRANPHFAITDADAASIAGVCRRLEGIPLAIELAAARMSGLRPARLAEELDEQIPLTATTARGVPSRQATLWASIDWSYRLLTAQEQAAFRCLTCFAGTFTAAAFAAVISQAAASRAVPPRGTLAGPAPPGPAPPGSAPPGSAPGGVPPGSAPPAELLYRLADKSLVSLDGQTRRYHVLDSLRTFATERANEAAELMAIRDAHADYYSSWLAGLDAGNATDEALDLIDAEYPNVRAALIWSVETRSHRAAAIVADLGVAWHQQSRFHDSLVLGDAALEIVAEDDPPAWARCVRSLAIARMLGGDITFIPVLARAEAIARAAGDDFSEGCCRFVQGMAPPFDDAQFRASYRLASAASAPLLAATAAAALACGGSNKDTQAWLRRADEFSGRVANTGVRALYQLAWAEYLVELGRMTEAAEITVPVAFDARTMPNVRLLGIGRTLQVALNRRDLGLAELVIEMVTELTHVWPMGQWEHSAWTTVSGLQQMWTALLLGERPPALDVGVLGRATRMGLTPTLVRTVCRAATERGDHVQAAAVAHSAAAPARGSLMAASFAAIEAAHAAIDGDDALAGRRWSEVLSVAAQGEYLLLVCDALEGLGCLAARRAEAAKAGQLLAAAQQCRDDISYRYRFAFEQELLDRAREAVGQTVAQPPLPWRAAVDVALAG
jgi:predicted ATPase/DNA-binding XRE family transcriptional regulator